MTGECYWCGGRHDHNEVCIYAPYYVEKGVEHDFQGIAQTAWDRSAIKQRTGDQEASGARKVAPASNRRRASAVDTDAGIGSVSLPTLGSARMGAKEAQGHSRLDARKPLLCSEMKSRQHK